MAKRLRRLHEMGRKILWEVVLNAVDFFETEKILTDESGVCGSFKRYVCWREKSKLTHARAEHEFYERVAARRPAGDPVGIRRIVEVVNGIQREIRRLEAELDRKDFLDRLAVELRCGRANHEQAKNNS